MRNDYEQVSLQSLLLYRMAVNPACMSLPGFGQGEHSIRCGHHLLKSFV
jgi:hypothetical protein